MQRRSELGRCVPFATKKLAFSLLMGLQTAALNTIKNKQPVPDRDFTMQYARASQMDY
jgi:hypothetical protein